VGIAPPHFREYAAPIPEHRTEKREAAFGKSDARSRNDTARLRMADIIDGKAVGEEVVARVKALTAELGASGATRPGLAVVIVGEDPASQVYVASKSKKAKECGFHSVQHTLAAETSEAELLGIIAELNADPAIHGILVQLPLPKQVDSGRVIQ